MSLVLALFFAVTTVAQPAQETIYEAGPGITLPKVVKEVKPDYPEDAMESGVQGSIHIRCVITPDGKPSAIEVTKRLQPRLDEVAVAALKQWEFEPGRREGKPVPVRVTIEMTFRLK